MAISVVLAEDDDALRFLYRLWLERDDRFTLVADVGDGHAAVEAVVAHDPDLVVLDIEMPRCNGLEALVTLVEATDPATRPVLAILSAATPELVERRCLDLGADAFVGKVGEARQLLDTFASVHATHTRRGG